MLRSVPKSAQQDVSHFVVVINYVVETSTLKACLAFPERYNGKSSAQRRVTALRFVHSYPGEVHFAVKQTCRRFHQLNGQVIWKEV